LGHREPVAVLGDEAAPSPVHRNSLSVENPAFRRGAETLHDTARNTAPDSAFPDAPVGEDPATGPVPGTAGEAGRSGPGESGSPGLARGEEVNRSPTWVSSCDVRPRRVDLRHRAAV